MSVVSIQKVSCHHEWWRGVVLKSVQYANHNASARLLDYLDMELDVVDLSTMKDGRSGAERENAYFDVQDMDQNQDYQEIGRKW